MWEWTTCAQNILNFQQNWGFSAKTWTFPKILRRAQWISQNIALKSSKFPLFKLQTSLLINFGGFGPGSMYGWTAAFISIFWWGQVFWFLEKYLQLSCRYTWCDRDSEEDCSAASGVQEPATQLTHIFLIFCHRANLSQNKYWKTHQGNLQPRLWWRRLRCLKSPNSWF